MTLGEKMRQRRFQFGRKAGFENGFDQAYICRVIGLASQGQYSRAENDEFRLPLVRMQRFAALGGMTVVEAFPEWSLTRKERAHLIAGQQFLKDGSDAQSLTDEVDE